MKDASDKPAQRLVTTMTLVLALVLWWAAGTGWFGDLNRELRHMTLGVMLVILAGRAILTELGIRRHRIRRHFPNEGSPAESG